jgi:hypothetical protein
MNPTAMTCPFPLTQRFRLSDLLPKNTRKFKRQRNQCAKDRRHLLQKIHASDTGKPQACRLKQAPPLLLACPWRNARRAL